MFSIQCTTCEKDVSFTIEEVDDLDDFIESECNDAREEARQEEAAEYVDHIEPDLDILKDLSTAIRRGDTSEAELLLDKLAASAGVRAEEAVQQGRFSLRAVA